jgi:ribosomal protein S18 acetylase RimI-like enzyme
LLVRRASEADVMAVAAIKVAAWRHAYRGIVPQAVLDALTPEQVRAEWLGVAGDTFYERALVAEKDGALYGYAMFGPVQGDAHGHSGQLYAIYLQPALIGTGLGAQLFGAASARLQQDGHDSFLLWVFTANTRARRFYERQGGRLIADAALVTEIGGAQLPEVAYGFRASPALK